MRPLAHFSYIIHNILKYKNILGFIHNTFISKLDVNVVNVVLYFFSYSMPTVAAMPFSRISIPDDLMDLKPSSDLQSVSMSSLARKGTAVLRQLTDTAQAVAVRIQGHGSMVTMSQRQYDEMVALLQQLRQSSSDDGFTQALGERFDTLVATINLPGAATAMDAALFTDADTLNSNYHPGATETAQDSNIDPRSGRRQRRR